MTRLTFDGACNSTWSRDGKNVFATSGCPGKNTLFRMSSNGSGFREELLIGNNLGKGAESVSPDDRLLVYFDVRRETDSDIWILPLEGDRTPRPFLQTAADEAGARVSPDGSFLVYVSNASGRPEVYVQTFPEGGGKWQVSHAGGTEPVWARSGKELFYRSANHMMAVSVETEPTFTAGKPTTLFPDLYWKSGWFDAAYDVSLDGRRFLMIKSNDEGEDSTHLNVVQNWLELLKKPTR